MAHIEDRRRQGRGWRVRYRDPSGRERSKSFARKSDAERFLHGNEVEKLEGRWIAPELGRVTFRKWFARCWESTVDLRPSTRARDESYARTHILPAFGDCQLAAIDHSMVREWVARLSAAGKAPATVQKAYQILSKTMAAAVDARMIAANPCARVPLPRIERLEMRFLAPDEIAALADAIDPRYRAFTLLGAYGGLRLGEMLGLRRERVDLLRRRVDVAEILVEVRGHHHTGPPKTRAGRRSVPIPRIASDALGQHLERVEPGARVFTAPEGGPVRASQFRRRFWTPAVRAAGLEPLRIHDLRHSAVALWIAAGASPNEIAARAGHTSVAVVLDRYGHLLPGSEERVTDALDSMAAGVSDASVVNLPRPHRGPALKALTEGKS